jgi:hypothetical protein
VASPRIRQPCGSNLSDAHWQAIMERCWEDVPGHRPSAAELVETVEAMVFDDPIKVVHSPPLPLSQSLILLRCQAHRASPHLPASDSSKVWSYFFLPCLFYYHGELTSLLHSRSLKAMYKLANIL